MASNSLRMSAQRWTRSGLLDDAVPKLKKLFQGKLNEDGAYPLFPSKVRSQIWRTVPIDRSREAAILVPIVSFEGSISLLFTTRSSNMPTHASEVSYPGGHFDTAVDSSLEETAVREATEELLGDYPWEDVEIIGRATALPSMKGTPVTPVLAVLPYEISRETFPGCPDEVDEVFCVSLEELARIETTEPNERFKSNIPVYPTTENQRIWGLTAVVTRPLLHNLLNPIFLQTRNSRL
jgi:8-oxo-dGTP pyrophosphatase MutT (NUDIX family)